MFSNFWSYSNCFICIILVCLFSSCNKSSEAADVSEDTTTTQRIISLNGSITECLYRVGLGDQLVGRDVTSTYPSEKVNELPSLGHISQLNTEAILNLEPDVILVDAAKADSDKLSPLKDAGIKIIPIELAATLDNGLNIAKQLAAEVSITEEQMVEMEEAVEEQKATLAETVAQFPADFAPAVLFIYARGTGRLMVAGAETEAASMIEMCGGKNAIKDFTNFQAMTPEALLAAAPDVILMFESGLASLDGKEGLSQIPGMKEVPAFVNDRIITMDGAYLLGFGPRAGEAANELASKLLEYSLEINTK